MTVWTGDVLKGKLKVEAHLRLSAVVAADKLTTVNECVLPVKRTELKSLFLPGCTFLGERLLKCSTQTYLIKLVTFTDNTAEPSNSQSTISVWFHSTLPVSWLHKRLVFFTDCARLRCWCLQGATVS